MAFTLAFARLVLAALCGCAQADAGGNVGDPTSQGLPLRRLTGADAWLATAMHYVRGTKRHGEVAFVFVGFKSGGVAKVLSNTGEVLWAHEPTAVAASIQSLAFKMGVVVVTTEDGKVQAWDGEHGHLKWERACPGGVAHKVLNVGGGDDGFAFACAAEVETRTRDGEVAWSAPAPAGFAFKAAGAVDAGNNICALALGTGFDPGAVSVKYNSYTGKVITQKVVPETVAKALAGSNFIMTGGRLVWPTAGQVHSYGLCGNERLHSRASLAAQDTASLEAVQDTPGIFSVSSGAVTGVFTSNDDGLRRLHLADGPAFVGPVHGGGYGETGRWVAVGTHEEAGCRVRIINVKHGEEEDVAAEPGAFSALKYGKGVRVVGQERVVGGGFRAFIATSGPESLLSIQAADMHWARHGFDAESVLVQSNTTKSRPRPAVEL